MNAIVNPLHATAIDLPAAADATLTTAAVEQIVGDNSVQVDPNTAPAATEAPAPAPAPKEVLPQDEQLALDIDNIDKQIEILQKRREGKATLLANLDKLASITEGTVLVVTQGRAGTTRQVEGVVIAIRDGKYKVSVGEGFDAENIVVSAPQIVEVKPA